MSSSGVDDQRTGAAVRDGGAALQLWLERVAHADDGGNAQRVRARIAVWLEPEPPAVMKPRTLDLSSWIVSGRGQVVSAEQHRHIGRNAALHDAAQDAQNALADILDVGGAGLHIGVVHRGKHLGKLL